VAGPPLVIDDRSRGLFRVHRSAFVSGEILRREKELIFDRMWLYVGHESEIPNPNDFVTRKVGGRSVIFARDRAGTVRVMLNTCRHRGAEVCREAAGNRKVFTCFYHGWAYGNDGGLVSVPDGDSYAAGFDRADHGLHQPRSGAYRGFVFITFGPGSPDLRAYLADATYLLDLVADQSESGMEVIAGTHQYAMKANWKLLMENSCDGYHGFTVHQTYFEMMMNLGVTPGLVATENGRGASADLGNGHAVVESPELGMPLMSDDILAAARDRRAGLARRFGEAHLRKMINTTRNMIVFPSFVVIDLNFGIQLRTMYPTAPDHTEITGWQLMPRDAARALKSYRIDNALTFWGPAGLATPDDVEALDQCQRGFASVSEVPYSDLSRGMTSDAPTAVDELQMRTFWRRWNELVTGEPAQPEGPRYDTSYLAAELTGAEAS
jgi:phenylpropionate dioxygenase-like ring-hydroxylating dioxygenase large terminal subunit